jgi:hypothetical protein
MGQVDGLKFELLDQEFLRDSRVTFPHAGLHTFGAQMKILDPGHSYLLKMYDIEPSVAVGEHHLIFMKRQGPGYPGNFGQHAGTNCQEVLRALIDRVKYVDKQIPHPENKTILTSLRRALLSLDVRAAERRGAEGLPIWPLPSIDGKYIEDYEPCPKCGHLCGDTCK